MKTSDDKPKETENNINENTGDVKTAKIDVKVSEESPDAFKNQKYDTSTQNDKYKEQDNVEHTTQDSEQSGAQSGATKQNTANEKGDTVVDTADQNTPDPHINKTEKPKNKKSIKESKNSQGKQKASNNNKKDDRGEVSGAEQEDDEKQSSGKQNLLNGEIMNGTKIKDVSHSTPKKENINNSDTNLSSSSESVKLEGKRNTAMVLRTYNETKDTQDGQSYSEDFSLDGDFRLNVTQCRCMPKRYVLAILSFFGFFNVYCLRVDLSVALVAMTNNHTRVKTDGTEYWVPAEFEWNSQLQGHILSAFYYGYLITQIPGGYIAARFGGKTLFGMAILFSAIFTLLTPMASRKHWSLLFGLRFLEGLCEGCIYPAMYSIWSRWAPPVERAKLVTIPHSGSYSGSVAGTLIAGYLCELCGWAWVFYLFGLFALLWVVIWQIMVSDSPEDDRHISVQEKNMIVESLKEDQTSHLVKGPLPWCQIFTSMPFLAILVAHTCEGWGFNMLQTSLPKYLAEAMDFRISKSAEYTAIMYLVMGMTVFLAGQLSDCFRQNTWLTATMLRKSFTIIGFSFNAITFLISAQMTVAQYAVITLIIGAGIESLAWVGFGINHLDIAPRFASILFGITNTCATIPGILAPLLVGAITSTREKAAWDAVFYMSSFMFLVGAVFYGFFASAQRQSWADDNYITDDEEDNLIAE